MTELSPWSDRQFSNAMRKAGWKNHGQGCYIHRETSKKFMAWTWTTEIGEAWKEWAAARQTPAPF